mgnify:CR=1 FL=1
MEENVKPNEIGVTGDSITVIEAGKKVTYQFASFGDRLGARIVDVLILIIPAMIPFLSFFIVWLYFALQHSSDEQSTVGQNACGIKLIKLSGKKVSFGRATGRWFSMWLVSGIGSIIFFLPYLMYFFTDKKQTLHDLICETTVVNKQPVNIES